MFAYAKPVTINPYRFNNPKRDTMLVSFAGPASNIILAVVFSLLLRVLLLMPFFSLHLRTIFIQLFAFAVLINVFLAILNLIPIPPLDGSGIVSNLLPPDLAYQYERLRPYGFIIFIALLYLGLIGKIMMPVVRIFSVVLLGGII